MVGGPHQQRPALGGAVGESRERRAAGTDELRTTIFHVRRAEDFTAGHVFFRYSET